MIEFRAITKSFGGVRVLRDVSFAAAAGRTLGLVGENGAGKSTLMNILGGNLRPDAGEMRIHGRPYAPRHPRDATRQGIAFVHQELNLFPNLSIAENLLLVDLPRWPWTPLIRRGALARRTRELLAQVGLARSPATPVERLSAGERQLVEIAKALGREAWLLILDEPTSSLGMREAERLFAVLDRLRAAGMATIYISHALGDVLRLCDDVVVLRDGEVAGAGPRGEFSQERMIALMVGRSLSHVFPVRARRAREAPSSAGPATPAPASPPALEARRVSVPGVVRDISFSLAHGEVVGVAGVMGAGRSELARILFGLVPCDRGEILLDGRPVHRHAPRRRIRQGLAFLTENRREEGLCMEAAIADNIALVSLRRHARGPLRLLDAETLRGAVGAVREAVRLSPAAHDLQPVKTLSGGNQQKVVLAKWLLAEPGVLILDEPTRGIDVGAKSEIYQLIHGLAAQGAGVLFISSELEELLGLCDRILVMRRGEIGAAFRREEFDRERILAAALGEMRSAGV